MARKMGTNLRVSQAAEIYRLLCSDDVLMQKGQGLTRYLSYLSLAQRFIFATEPGSASNAELEASRAASQVLRLAESLQSYSVPKLRMSHALRT